MARDNYSYKKYQRELQKKKKKEEKLQRRLDRKNELSNDGTGKVSNEGVDANPGI